MNTKTMTPTEALHAVSQRLGALHATLAEADGVDERLHRLALDDLMDALDMIEATLADA